MEIVLRLLLRRLMALPLMMLGVSALVFIILQFTPGDPASVALGESASDAAKELYREQHGLNDPVIVQYFRFIGNVLVLDFGLTTPPEQPITSLIAKAFPLTLQLTFIGVFLAAIVSFSLGIIAALYRDRWADQVIRLLSVAAVATPSFWLGILLIQYFSLELDWLPSGGFVPFSEDPTEYFRSMALPSLALAIPVCASLIRVVRTTMVEEMDKDYVRTAIGNGVPYATVIRHNVLRNALITPVTVLGLRVGYLLGGAVVIEQIFDLPGMGKLIFNGIVNHDLHLVQGVVLTIAFTFVLVNIIVDILYLLINPKIRSL
ncbi:ABC transporter permease [Glaesserella parasuis]|uniref:ABC transporter permease n=3 Tax=Glaesserella parasuis TaxID=738 RepID=A0A084EXZ4_GLAPU|nr:ABC transporter permease [Glaesserella parasuis]EQA02655.1 binding--dependent transport system inner membrane component family protein [Glaesserella parasuis SW114]EQA05628.1 binding--dependent transport system inner membrane component family protein [Glaesserella parasuis 12939]EQA13005.1 binding--dependent transport system inner membrane component family protein [Glaesserella parasuis 174]AMW17198.1 ABC transporter permease [Glaesserella parasuis]ATW43538.1 ABC transporter permease [Glaes